MKETLKHREAFEYYYSIGDKRNITKVAQKFTVSRASVSKWSRVFNWQKRIEQRDIEIGNKLEKKTNEIVLNTKTDYREQIQNSLKMLKDAIRAASIKGKDGELKLNIAVTSINDLNQVINSIEKLIKLDIKLMGEGIIESQDNKLTIEVVGVDMDKFPKMEPGGKLLQQKNDDAADKT